MERTTATTENNHQPISHSPHNNPSIAAASLFGMAITAVLFAILGFCIGLDRAPGSFYAYGLSCFFWPIVSMTVLGSLVGGSLGFVFGSIAHASDVAPEETPATISTRETTTVPHNRLTLHLPRH